MNESTEMPVAEARAPGRAAERPPPSGAARLVERIETFSDRIGQVAAWIGFGFILVVVGNVVLRYVFSAGTVWFQELEWHLIPPVVMIGNAYALRHGEHVRVDLFFDHFPAWLKHLIDLAVGAAIVIISIIVIYVSIPWVLQSYHLGEGSPDPGGLPHRFILKAFVPFGFLLLLIQGIAEGLKAAIPLFDRQGGHDHGT